MPKMVINPTELRALAVEGARIRLGEIQAEQIKLLGWFPELKLDKPEADLLKILLNDQELVAIEQEVARRIKASKATLKTKTTLKPRRPRTEAERKHLSLKMKRYWRKRKRGDFQGDV